jgi:hypothetical protein
MRAITKKGEDQCTESAGAYFSELNVCAMLSSPARRAAETAMRMAAMIETEESKHQTLYLKMIEGVHPAGMSETCEHLFESMGYGPLRKFFEVEGGEAAFREYGDAVCREMSNSLAGPGFGEAVKDNGCVALFGEYSETRDYFFFSLLIAVSLSHTLSHTLTN